MKLGEIFMNALENTVLGMGMVFAVLIIIIIVIALSSRIIRSLEGTGKKKDCLLYTSPSPRD